MAGGRGQSVSISISISIPIRASGFSFSIVDNDADECDPATTTQPMHLGAAGGPVCARVWPRGRNPRESGRA